MNISICQLKKYTQMKEIIIKVPENKFEFALELIKSLGFKFSFKKEEKEDFKIHQWQKDLVLERIKTAKPEDYIPIENALNQIKRK
jgi:hypothetical protein